MQTLAEPGQPVRRGQVLARLDASSIEDAYKSARSAVTNARNSLAVAQREEERQRVLVEAGAVARATSRPRSSRWSGRAPPSPRPRRRPPRPSKQLGNTRVTRRSPGW